MNEKLDLKSAGQHWKKDNNYWCSFDYYGVLTVVKCKWYKRPNQENILNFEYEPGKELVIKNCPIEWFDDAEYFEYVPTLHITKDDFKSVSRIRR